MFGDSVAEVVRGGEFEANRCMNQKAGGGGGGANGWWRLS